MQRRISRPVRVGNIWIGGQNPVVVQSMTNTDTADADATARQVFELAEAGSEVVRVTVNNAESAAAIPEIRRRLDIFGCSVPLVGDFHFNGHKLLQAYPECAQVLDKYRINPGNVGKGSKKDEQFLSMIEVAIQHDKPVRIGVNWGSLDQSVAQRLMDENALRSSPWTPEQVMQEAIILSALESAEQAVAWGLSRDKIVLSCKVSHVQSLIALYRDLSKRCDYALHLGLTEAGMGSKGIVASSAALAVLLQEGIGDTIRISLTPAPNESRTTEVLVAQELLQSMGLRAFAPMVTACPGCGRTTSTFFQELAMQIQSYLREQMPIWRPQYPGVEMLKVAVMGCVVNGPGESKLADIGISLPGNGEVPVAPVYIDGQKAITLKGEHIAQEFKNILFQYIDHKYGSGPSLSFDIKDSKPHIPIQTY